MDEISPGGAVFPARGDHFVCCAGRGSGDTASDQMVPTPGSGAHGHNSGGIHRLSRLAHLLEMAAVPEDVLSQMDDGIVVLSGVPALWAQEMGRERMVSATRASPATHGMEPDPSGPA